MTTQQESKSPGPWPLSRALLLVFAIIVTSMVFFVSGCLSLVSYRNDRAFDHLNETFKSFTFLEGHDQVSKKQYGSSECLDVCPAIDYEYQLNSTGREFLATALRFFDKPEWDTDADLFDCVPQSEAGCRVDIENENTRVVLVVKNNTARIQTEYRS